MVLGIGQVCSTIKLNILQLRLIIKLSAFILQCNTTVMEEITLPHSLSVLMPWRKLGSNSTLMWENPCRGLEMPQTFRLQNSVNKMLSPQNLLVPQIHMDPRGSTEDLECMCGGTVSAFPHSSF